MRHWLLALLLWPCVAISTATAQDGIAPDDAHLRIVFEKRTHLPHPGELVMLQIHGTFKVAVIREKLIEPDLSGFDWMQLGEDRWYKAREDGFEVLKFERRMALYPQQAGTLTVAPFTHQLELLSRTSETVPIDALSNEATIEVAPPLDTSQWWFPVRGIEINDNWSNQPEALPDGGSALRVIALTILGTLPQRIPPMPELTGAGVHIFPHPEHRIVSLGPDGPVTRVFWRWTVRPKEGSAGYLNQMRMAYFDTGTRERQEVIFAAQRIAYVGGPQEVLTAEGLPVAASPTNGASPGAPPPSPMPAWAVPAAGGAGLLIGLAGLLLGYRRDTGWTWPDALRRDPVQAALRRGVKQGDAGAVRQAAHMLCTREGMAPPASLAALDRALYGTGSEVPDLSRVAKETREGLRG